MIESKKSWSWEGWVVIDLIAIAGVISIGD